MAEIPDFKALLETDAYDFLRRDERFAERIMLLTVSGSYGYGTNCKGSDIDIRGIALQSPSDLLGLTSFETYTDRDTDTVIYGFNKFVRLLLECNPNCTEILGMRPDRYLRISPEGQLLLDHQQLFLSKRAIHSFGGYASAQLRRLQNATARDRLPQQEREKHILNSVRNALDDFNRRNEMHPAEQIRLYIDKAVTEGFETEVFVDAHCDHMPLRVYNSMFDTMNMVVRDYDRLGRRNEKKDDNHLNKHAMHLIRLLVTGIDVLERHEVITYRTRELPLLMDIRGGKYMQEDGTMSPEFYEILDEYDHRFREASEKTTLPDEPDMVKVGQFVEMINRKAISQ